VLFYLIEYLIELIRRCVVGAASSGLGGLLQIGVVTGVAGLRRFGRRQTLSVPAVAGSAGGEVAAAEGGVRWTCVPVCLRSLITMMF